MNLAVNISRTLDNFELRADFTITAKRCGVFGPSGSGKSTLMHLLAGLLTPDKGRICLDDRVMFDSAGKLDQPPEQRRIGVVFQHSHLFPHLNVRRNLFYGWKRTPEAERRIDPDALFNVLNLEPLLERGVASLSGGERQRVALARTVLACPHLILMDEPLTGLDEKLKYQIIPYLKKVFAQFDIPLLFISHSMREMRLLTEEVLVFEKGEVSQCVPIEDLARNHLTTSDRGYANMLSLNNPEPCDDLWCYRWGGETMISTEPGTSGENLFELGSKDITLFKRHPEATSARNLIACRVGNIFGDGNRVGVELNCAGGRLVSQIVPESVRELEIKEGAEVIAVIKASALRRLC